MPAGSDPLRYAPVTRPYRRWLAAAAALLLHLALLGALAGAPLIPAPVPRTSLDVVLVTRSGEAPAQADAIAESDQRAAGNPEEAAPAEARTAPAVASEAALAPLPPAAPGDAPRLAAAPAALSTPSVSGREQNGRGGPSIRERGLATQVAGPEAEASRQAARRAGEARYVEAWIRRIEAYGNRVRPGPRELHGELRIRVVIGRDGELRQAEVIQSSGHPELDQAALETVNDAGPYPPFDHGMGELESLSITRVWRFGQGNHYGVR